MQNAPDRDPRSHLPTGLIKLSRQLLGVITGVLIAGVVGSLIMGVVSSAIYDLVKNLVLQNLWMDAVYLICITLFIALIYVISLHDVPERASLQKTKKRPTFIAMMIYILLPLLGIFGAGWYFTPLHSLIFPPDTGLGVSYVSADAAPAGLCDGSCVIDVDRLNGKLKKEAADQIKLNNIERACEDWQLASMEDTADAEAKIDIENHCRAKNVKQYIDFVVVIQLGDKNNVYLNGMSRNILQGAYLAQKQYNDTNPEGPNVYLFIANIGDPVGDSAKQLQQQVASRIIQSNGSENTHKIVGVIGLPYDSNDIVQSLSQSGYPMISVAPASSSSSIAYFRSVAPTFQNETDAAVNFLESQHRMHVALYSAYGYGGNYRDDLTTSFAQSFTGRLVVQNTYTEGSVSDLNDSANIIANAGADAVYFVGPPDDASVLNAALRRLHANIIVVGSDVTYQWVYASHTGQQRENFNGLFFTAFAYHSPPGTPNGKDSPMVTAYRESFNPNKYYVGYFYDRPGSDAILAFDATNLLIRAATDALNQSGAGGITMQSLWRALVAINALNGFSGQINYADASSSFPDQKAVFVLSIQTAGNRYEGTYAGRYDASAASH